MVVITDPRCTEYHAPNHPEHPSRILRSVDFLQDQKFLPIQWESPGTISETQLLRVHTRYHLERLLIPVDFDLDTKACPNIRHYAELSAAGMLRALDFALQGMPAFSLMRPPGHHAMPERAMGFCYLNNVAIAALEARSRGIRRIAVFDFDVHHGNGTEHILYGQEGFAYFSVHQFPAYPGTGYESQQNVWNYPVLPGADRETYQDALKQALDRLHAFAPDLVMVSAGFDAYRNDPIANENLEEEDYHWLGQQLRKLGVPFCSALEGGYSEELPQLILAYLLGCAGH